MKRWGVFLIIVVLVVALCVFFTVDKNGDDVQNGSGEIAQDERYDGLEDEEDNSIFEMSKDDEKLMFDVNGQYKMIFEFEENKVSGYYYEYEFASEDEAISASKAYQNEENTSVLGVTREGTKVLLKLDHTNYSNMNREQIEAMFTYLIDTY